MFITSDYSNLPSLLHSYSYISFLCVGGGLEGIFKNIQEKPQIKKNKQLQSKQKTRTNKQTKTLGKAKYKSTKLPQWMLIRTFQSVHLTLLVNQQELY